jgi:RNA polymerase sigma-70 factor (ECF subfamily)
VAGERKAQGGGHAAVANEAMTHLDHLYRVAFHLEKDSVHAEDLVQETFVRALAAHGQFAPGTNMKAWLTKILHNIFFDRYRQKRREIAIEDGAVPESESWPGSAPPTPETQVLRKELDQQITRVLRTIPEEFRLPILLVDMGDFSYEEAAAILSCPIGTVRSRLSRGRKLLQQSLRQYMGATSKKIWVK